MDAHLIMEVLYFMRKKQEKITVPQTGTEMSETGVVLAGEPTEACEAEAVPQTGLEKETEDSVGSVEVSDTEEIPQTGLENEAKITGGSAEEGSAEGIPHTDLEKEPELTGGSAEVSGAEKISQTGLEKEADLAEIQEEGTYLRPISQTGTEKEADSAQIQEEGTYSGSIPHTDSELEAFSGSASQMEFGNDRIETLSHRQQNDSEPVSGVEQTQSRSDRAAGINRGARPRAAASILSIDEHLAVETDADRSRNDLLDLLESQKTGRILTGTIQGVERRSDTPGHSLAVLYHGDYKIIIPAHEAVEPPQEESARRPPSDVMHYLITKRLGAEVDYIVKGIDQETGLAAASRLEAMRARRKEYYFGTDREGNYILHSGICAEARVVSVIRAGIFVDLFGLELYVPLRELSYQRWMDAAAHFQPGQRILVRVLEVDRRDRNNVKASVSVKQAQENPYEKALRRYSVGNRYVGTVSVVDTTGVFVALDGGIDCLCSYPKRGRPPRGSRVTVRILGIDHVSNRIWGAITHIAVPR